MATKMMMILAGACLALAGCGGGGGGAPAAGPAEVVVVPDEEAPIDEEEPVLGELGPLDLRFTTPVLVMSADADKNTVRVGNLATITLNSINPDLNNPDAGGRQGIFSITLGLPDGTSVTITEEDISGDFDDTIGEDGGVIGVTFKTQGGGDDEDFVRLFIGLETNAEKDSNNVAEAITEALFVVVRVDPDADDPAVGAADFGIDTYMVTGIETVGLPEGSAVFSGDTFASVYKKGKLVSDIVVGNVDIDAFFDTNTVNIKLNGGGGEVENYSLVGNQLPIAGARYGGGIGGDVTICSSGCTTTVVTGSALGAFYGTLAEATAGVFGATGAALDASLNVVEVEIVGDFAAFDDTFHQSNP